MAGLIGEFKVELPEESWTWCPDDMTLGEWNMIEVELGGDVDFDAWTEGIDARRAMACQVLVWFLRLKAGRNEERSSVNFPIRRLTVMRLPKEPDSTPEISDASTSGPSPAEDTDPQTSTL